MVMAKQLETSFILSFLKLNTFPSNNVSQQKDMLASPTKLQLCSFASKEIAQLEMAALK